MAIGSESSKLTSKQALTVAVAVLAIAVSLAWMLWFSFGSSNQNAMLHRAVGQVMAEETVRVVAKPGKIVVVTVDCHVAPELKPQIDAFKKRLKELGTITVKDTIELDAKDNPKYRPVAGLSAKRFLKIARKNTDADAIVSFVGAPELTIEEIAQMKVPPKFIAETHSPEKLAALVEKKILLSAIVPRYEFPAPGPRKPKTERQWFDRYFQILSPDTTLVRGDDTP